MKLPYSQPAHVWIRTLERVLEERLSEPELSVCKLADHMHMSERQFFRKVKAETGLTPTKWIRRLRMQKAREMLKRGEVSTVRELALEVGYLRPDYFSRLYKSAFGHSPARALEILGK